MWTIRNLSLAAALSGLLLGVGGVVLADDAHHTQDAPKAAEPAPPKAAEPAPQPKDAAPAQGMGKTGSGMMGKMMGDGMMGMNNCPMMGGQKTAETIKAELGITAAQQSVWEAFAAAQAKSQSGMQDMQKTMMKMPDAKSPIERLEARIGGMDKHLASLKDLKVPLAALYAALSDEQKKKADTALAGIGCMM
jgi:hypothetical protein